MPPKRILVVEDEPDELDAIAESLRLSNFNVTAVLNATAALEACERQHFDAVVLDFLIPPTNGLELLARIRRIRPLVRSIILSGKIVTKDAAQVAQEMKQRADADEYFTKPVGGEQLASAINSLLSGTPETDWQKIATQVERSKKSTIKSAEEAAKFFKKKK
jgi:two-component system, OmpR family, response regulator